MSAGQLMVAESTASIPTVPAVTPMDLIARATAAGASIEQMRELFALKREIEADEARKAFVAAMARFKSSAIKVTKDRENKQYNSRYTSLGHLVDTVTPHLSANDLSASWDIEQGDKIKVTCIITHAAGHSARVPMTVLPDASGSKNPIQQIKSAITYAKACTFESICGLASTDANLDDDGNGAGAPQSPKMHEGELVQALDVIAGAQNEEELKRAFNAWYKQAQEIGDKAAMADIIAAKNKRKAAL